MLRSSFLIPLLSRARSGNNKVSLNAALKERREDWHGTR